MKTKRNLTILSLAALLIAGPILAATTTTSTSAPSSTQTQSTSGSGASDQTDSSQASGAAQSAAQPGSTVSVSVGKNGTSIKFALNGGLNLGGLLGKVVGQSN